MIGKGGTYSQTKSPNTGISLRLSLGFVLFALISILLVHAETIPVGVDGTFYDVEYIASGMSVSGIEADLELISLILTVDVPDGGGTLEITLERSFFDSVYQGEDYDYIVLADGDDTSFTETSTSQSRTLNITLPSGTEEVEIIGSDFAGMSADETPVEEAPAVETPVDETPAEDVSADETPVEEAPAVETPVDETPIKDVPVDETPVEEAPRTQCGPGTVLKDGVCTLDETCGPGTILEDGVCVLDSAPAPSSGYFKGFGKELVYGVVAAFVVAGAVGIILALMSRAGKSRN